MNLLPKSREEFSQKEYWDSFFKKRGAKAFEWYCEYPELSEHLHKYIKQQNDILIIGCGNSTLGRDLYDIGYSKITNIDISQVVIRQMLAQNEKERPNLKYLQMDALNMSFNDEHFSVVLDKVVCTKFKALPQKILEVNLTDSDKMQRYESIADVIEQISSVQQAAFICSGLKRTSIGQESEVSLDLYKAGDVKPRFTVYVVDAKHDRHNSQYAAFIVPQGREAEWLFSTKMGRKHLIKMTKTNRLAIVTMHRGQQFGDFDQVQSELNDAICNLAPPNCNNRKIPFLSLGSDVGKRETRLESSSQFSGDFAVEDVEIEGNKFRRLFYLSSQLVIQSEAKLKTIKTRKGKREIVDLTHLTCKHHIYMSVATHAACNGKHKPSIIAVGLGGGGLCSFLHKFLPHTKITAVDIDPEMLKVATDWFGLSQSDSLKVVVKDGVQYLEEAAKNNEHFDAILFDVDSKDSTMGLSCPPKQFLENSVIENTKV
ncbi:Methyltransf 25, and/or Spermine synth domain containing protein [Asbolus verrucosus]|uniref:Methyltransf 25, and/or Spermine synth domain containing protein n=1 Tax=Asbolus verrucosus TaxID=1661398 RepID=A0A482W7T1_ASBVE|nr:Methyltransf 25, and/or Spermine synth domain containing protein [Asbolus verrucosus]